MYIVDCAPGYEQYKWNPSMGGCNPYPCTNTAPCIPCKNQTRCGGFRIPEVDPIPYEL
jgi:hypothetical protein